jgi:hypothetical protein
MLSMSKWCSRCHNKNFLKECKCGCQAIIYDRSSQGKHRLYKYGGHAPRRRLGIHNGRWKGGVKITRGYRYIYTPNHPFCTSQGYVLEHRLVMEKHIGRYLDPEEVVHHVDGNRLNSRIDNLQLMSSRKEHNVYHPRPRRLDGTFIGDIG